MNLNIQAVKFSMSEDQTDYIDKKFERLNYAEDLLTDVICTVKEDKKFIYDCTVNFRWGPTAHVATDNYDFRAGVNKLLDMLDAKIKKEKEKVQEKQ